MSKIYTSADQLIGHTPLLELTHIEAAEGLEAKLLAKLEYFNPAGSVKDRIAKAMLDDAEAAGKLNKDTTIIEPTSGNTGIGLASVAAAQEFYEQLSFYCLPFFLFCSVGNGLDRSETYIQYPTDPKYGKYPEHFITGCFL